MTFPHRVLAVAEHDHASIRPSTRTLVAAARQCGSEVHLLVAGHNCGSVAADAARLTGVTRVLHVDAPYLADGLAEELAAQVLALAPGYSHLIFAASSTGKSTAPRVAALLDSAQISDAIRVIDPDTFDRPVFAGNAITTVRSADPVKVLTIRTTAFDPVSDGDPAPVERVTPAAPRGLSTFVERTVVAQERPELSAARVVVSGGRALGSAENFMSVLAPLADKLGAALGASRAAVDAGYAPNDWQVGQTGKIVAPQLYVACGISGAIQHQAGMKDTKVIVAINKDPDAPIFDIADYGLVADLFEAVPQIIAGL